MNQKLSTEIQELDTVALTHDIPEHYLKQGDIGAVVHCYHDGKAFEVEFVNDEGYTTALLTLTHADIDKPTISNHSTHSTPQPMSDKPKVQMNFNAPVHGAAGNVEGDMIVNAQSKNLAEAAAEIEQLLNQLAQTYPGTYLYEFEQEIPRNQRIRDLLIAGGIELIKVLCPLAGIPIEMGRKWLETARQAQN